MAGVALIALGWLWWRGWFPIDAVVAAAVGVAGVALGDMDLHFGVALGDIVLHFAWQAWHFYALMALGWLWWRACFPVDAVVHAAAVGVAGVALGDHMDLHFAWQAWHLWHWAGSGGTLGSQLMPLLRRGTWRQQPPLCVAGVALGDINLHFAWQAWHL